MADYSIKITLDDSEVDPKLAELEGKIDRIFSEYEAKSAKSAGKSAGLFGADMNASALSKSFSDVKLQIDAGNLSQEEGLAVMRQIVAEEQKRVSILAGKTSLTDEEVATLGNLKTHQTEYNAQIAKGLGEYETTGIPALDRFQQKVQEVAVQIQKMYGPEAANKFLGMFDGLKTAAGAVAGVVIGITVMKKVITATTDEILDEEAALAQLSAVLKSTGGAAGLSKTELTDMAQAMAELSTYSNEAVLEAENMLLTFTNVGEDVFPEATQVILDTATAMGTDLTSEAQRLGKALNDPVTGLDALTEVGVTFTDEQKEVIKSLAETGDTAGAQKVILDELAKEFGGSAAAFADSFAGIKAEMEDSKSEVLEAFGQSFKPMAEGFLKLGIKINEWVASAVPLIKTLTVVLTGLGAAILIVNIATGNIGGLLARLAAAVLGTVSAGTALSGVFNLLAKQSGDVSTAMDKLDRDMDSSTTEIEKLESAYDDLTAAQKKYLEVLKEQRKELAFVDMNAIAKELSLSVGTANWEDQMTLAVNAVNELISDGVVDWQTAINAFAPAFMGGTKMTKAFRDFESELDAAIKDTKTLAEATTAATADTEYFSKMSDWLKLRKKFIEAQKDIGASTEDILGNFNEIIKNGDELGGYAGKVKGYIEELKTGQLGDDGTLTYTLNGKTETSFLSEDKIDAINDMLDVYQSLVDYVADENAKIEIQKGLLDETSPEYAALVVQQETLNGAVDEWASSLGLTVTELEEVQTALAGVTEYASKYDTVMSAVESGVMTQEAGAKALGETFDKNMQTILSTATAMAKGEEITQDQLDAYEQAVAENEAIAALMEEEAGWGAKISAQFAEMDAGDIAGIVEELANGVTDALSELGVVDEKTAGIIEDSVSLAGNAARVAAGDVTAIVPALLDALSLSIKIFDRVSNTFDKIKERTTEILSDETLSNTQRIEALRIQAAELSALEARTKREKKRNEITAERKSIEKEIAALVQAEDDAKEESLATEVSILENRRKVLLNSAEMAANAEEREKYEAESEALLKTEIDVLSKKLSLADDEAEKAEFLAELSNKQLELYNLQNEALEDQAELIREIQDLLSEQVDLGLLDTENIYDQIRAGLTLSAEGLAGMDLASALSDVGFQSAQHVVNVAAINTTVYTSNENVVTNRVLESITNAM